MTDIISSHDSPFRQGMLAIVLVLVGVIAFYPMFAMKYKGFRFNAQPGHYLPAYTKPPEWNNPNLYFRRGSLDFDNGLYQKAIGYFDIVLSRDSMHIEALKKRALALARIKDYRAATMDLSRIISLQPRYERALLLRASLYERLGEHQRCYDDLTRAGVAESQLIGRVRLLPDPATANW